MLGRQVIAYSALVGSLAGFEGFDGSRREVFQEHFLPNELRAARRCAFLRARRSYLSEEQKAVYADVLADQPQAASSKAEPSTTESSEPQAPKRGRNAKASTDSEA
ncbi:MAG TPA: hypothetical protein VFA15_02545 [Nitrososphaera sp.]|nr:hypothetical protein [Nitrososphaera sp.]